MTNLHAFERHLKQHLAQWFSAGFLNLQRVTWNSPAALLEKVILRLQTHYFMKLHPYVKPVKVIVKLSSSFPELSFTLSSSLQNF